MAAMAKATGIEISSLTKIATGFDEFDKGAESAAKLNAILGTQLSTLEMLNATDSERIMMIKREVQASVGNFDSLNKFEKMYIAQAMGVSDVAEAQRLLNMSTAEYQSLLSGQREAADVQAEIAEATERLVPLGQTLKLLGAQFLLAFAPFIEVIADLASGLMLIVGFFGKIIDFISPIIPLALTLGSAFMYISAAATPIGWVVGGIIGLVTVFKQLYDLFTSRVNPVFLAWPIFMATGLGALLANLKPVQRGVKMLKNAFFGLFGVAKENTDTLQGGGFDVEAMAKIDTSKVAAGFREIKSAVMELSNIKMSGMLAFTTDGSKTSMIMGSVATEMALLLNGGKIEVDVKIPEFEIPKFDVKVFIGNKEFQTYVRTEALAVYNDR